MVTRRKLILSAAAALLAPVLPRHAAAADDPAGILTAIYTRVARGKGDGGGTFVIQTKASRTKYLSNALVALWAKADARTRKGDGGPVDFDPVTNSQDPDVKSFKVVAEKQEADKADGRRHDRKSSAGGARQGGRQDHPLRLCPRGRPMEDRRHQGRRRRRPVVGPRPARRFIEALGLEVSGLSRETAGHTAATGGPCPQSLRMVSQFLVAQAPILPKLKHAQQDDDCAEGDMPGPKHVVAGVTEDER